MTENELLDIMYELRRAMEKVKKGLDETLSVIRKPTWAYSALKNPIALYHSNGFQWNRNSRPILLMGGVHGDEPEGVALAEATLNWLMQDSTRMQTTVKVPWIVIPCLNPDGYLKNQRVNGQGVDLNRNYPSSNWSNDYDLPKYYPGPQPGSEPEIRAVVKIIEQLNPRLIIHCHSWKPCIVLTGEKGLKDAQALSKCSGYPVVESIGYPTPGSLSHYGWTDHGIPIICIEESERVPSCEIWPRFSEGVQRIFCDPSNRE